MSGNSNVEILRGDPKKAINKLAYPIIGSLLLVMLNNIIDSVWVAGLGSDPLAAIGYITPLFMILVGVGNGIGAGANSLISRFIGAKDKKGADSADEKLESAMFETRVNHNLKEAMRLVNSAIDEIGSYSELNDLKQWALSLKSEIKGDMEDVAADKRYEGILKRKGRDKLVRMCGYDRMFNSNDLVFRLVKEKSGFINVCYGDMKIGYVSENWGHEICYSSVSELTNLPKVSYAKYFCRYPGRYNYVPDSGWVILELLDDYSPRKYWTEIKKEIKLNIDDDLLKKGRQKLEKK